MAFPDNNLDLFELTEKTLAKINDLGKVNLANYDLSFHFSKDSNQLDSQLNFLLYIFEEEFGQTTYNKKYNTIEKMIKLMMSNLKNEYMYKNVRGGLIMTKIKNYKSQLYETIQMVKAKIAEQNDSSLRGVMVDIEEQRNNKQKEKNGMPFFVLTAQCRPKRIDIKIPIASNASDWEKDAILATLFRTIVRLD